MNVRALASLLLLLPGCIVPRVEDDSQALRVLTWSVNGAADDWPDRSETVIDAVLEEDPDLIGFQELELPQVLDLAAGLEPRYRWLGLAAEDGDEEGELVPIFWRRDSYQLSSEGMFWLSDAPQTPGSTWPGTDRPRIASWGQFRERSTGRLMLVLNTHWQPGDLDAQAGGAALTVQQLDLLAPTAVARIVVGALEVEEEATPFRTLRDGARLSDAYRVAQPGGADPTLQGAGRIDHVLVSAGLFRVEAVQVVAPSRSMAVSPEHRPVVADVSW